MAFCRAMEKGKRCVAYEGHIGKHDLMPLNSATVRMIEKQEENERKLGYGPEETESKK